MTNFSWWWKQCDVAESSRNSKSIDLLLRQTSRRRLMVREVSSCRIIRQNNKINSWGEEKVPESPPARQTHTHDCNIKRRRRRSDLTCCLTCRASASLHDCFHIQLPSSPLCWSVVSCVGARARAHTHTHTYTQHHVTRTPQWGCPFISRDLPASRFQFLFSSETLRWLKRTWRDMMTSQWHHDDITGILLWYSRCFLGGFPHFYPQDGARSCSWYYQSMRAYTWEVTPDSSAHRRSLLTWIFIQLRWNRSTLAQMLKREQFLTSHLYDLSACFSKYFTNSISQRMTSDVG